jgi:hypothetical protein
MFFCVTLSGGAACRATNRPSPNACHCNPQAQARLDRFLNPSDQAGGSTPRFAKLNIHPARAGSPSGYCVPVELRTSRGALFICA